VPPAQTSRTFALSLRLARKARKLVPLDVEYCLRFCFHYGNGNRFRTTRPLYGI
jgi:hypothetical protein